MDRIDRKILTLLQRNCALSVAEVAEQVGLSASPCWRRIQNLEAAGVIARRVALLDRQKLNLGVVVFVRIKTQDHSQAWLQGFAAAVEQIDEVVEFYRMTGDIDYLLRIVVPSIDAYDAVYKRLIGIPGLADVSASFAMEEIKHTTALPLDYVD